MAQQSTVLLPIVAGGIGGIASLSVTTPLQQSADTTLQKKNIISRTFSSDKIRTVLKGNAFNIGRAFTFAGSICLSYGYFCSLQSKDSSATQEAQHRFLAGAGAGSVAAFVTHPLDTLRARMPACAGNVSSISLRNVYSGFSPIVLRTSLFVGVQNLIYDTLRLSMTNPDATYHCRPSVALFMASGAIAGLAAQTAAYPLDTIRRTIQAEKPKLVPQLSTDSVAMNVEKREITQQLISVVRNNGGIRTLFRGIAPTYLKVIPAVAVLVTTRDTILGRLN